VFCNIGNPMQLGQKPVTFYRQILALVEYPEQMNSSRIDDMYPKDALLRAKKNSFYYTNGSI